MMGDCSSSYGNLLEDSRIVLPKKKTPEHRDVEEEDDDTHRNFPVAMRNHLIPGTAQETLRRFPKVHCVHHKRCMECTKNEPLPPQWQVGN